MKIIIATIKSWNIKKAYNFKNNNANDIYIFTDKNELTYEKVNHINPQYIFFPHWSWIISKEIYEKFNCVVFHITDLPFGRGGSPLQNLIDIGIENTKISALKVCNGIDSGDIYLKENLNLNGSADEIFMRASEIIFKDMIPKIINENIVPTKQKGEIVEFKRRNFSQSEILLDFNLKKIYDYIRMLDGEGYPKAFIRFGKYKLEFSRASLKNNKIIADVEIIDEDD
ncbi:methionyl-tRNA formyltransferase [Clostridium taeniosporum]|uniref:Methionyl-tRNA formyltransferase n=1 Tax=Clostridium taeniosporum TaxID=394958 RepID=A0A1D7XHV8_9CLOT|nr:methionyl-tRNA formyltransferase [Clostridium taeniosporum]AOR22915.1 methionyl-tRNA formyltransferase [Clostridium taeniosporum]